jgi:FMN-dependent NADH-azoreductase
MSKLLYIKANVKPEGQSRTYKISDAFIEEYKKNNPNDEVITLDLYKENIDFLKVEDLNVAFGPKTEESKKHPILKYAYQFASADKYVVAAPIV